MLCLCRQKRGFRHRTRGGPRPGSPPIRRVNLRLGHEPLPGAESNPAFMQYYSQRKPAKPYRVPMEGPLAMPLRLFRRLTDAHLRKLGVSSTTERKRILAMHNGEARAVTDFELVWGEDPAVELWQHVFPSQANRSVAFGRIVAALPVPPSVGNIRLHLAKHKLKAKLVSGCATGVVLLLCVTPQPSLTHSPCRHKTKLGASWAHLAPCQPRSKCAA